MGEEQVRRGQDCSGCSAALAVLTPDYLASEFTVFENVLAEHLRLEQAGTRLLVVLRHGDLAESPPSREAPGR